jgi:hypothetical protein
MARIALVSTLLLTACGGAGPLRGLRPDPGPPPAREVAVTTDQVIITGPQGFCVDPSSTNDRGATAFVLLGNCAVIANRRSEAQPEVPAVLTASVSQPDPPQSLRETIPELDQFFQSEEGRELLSRNGDAGTVEILDSFHQGDIYFLRARDSSAGEVEDVSAEYWRSYLDVGNRIATLTVLETIETPIESEAALATLQDYTNAVIDANSVAVADPVEALPAAAEVAEPPAPRQRGAGTLWNVGLFRRIMGR